MVNTTGTITNFTTTPNAIFQVGGDSFRVETAGQLYSLTNPDPQTLRFEVRQGDRWFANDSSSVERSEIDGSADRSKAFPFGTQININYQFLLEPNSSNGGFTNTASWFVVGQMHAADWVTGVWMSPPFAIELLGNKLRVVARYILPGGRLGNSSTDLKMLVLWTDPNPIVTNQYHSISIQCNVSNTSTGFLYVWLNGNQVVNYNGPLGWGIASYWEYGLYRQSVSQVVAAKYRTVTVTTGAPTPGEIVGGMIVGPPGPKGNKGDKGDKGDVGLKGDTGAQGEVGLKGDTGAQGEVGPQGEPGTSISFLPTTIRIEVDATTGKLKFTQLD